MFMFPWSIQLYFFFFYNIVIRLNLIEELNVLHIIYIYINRILKIKQLI